MKSNRFIKRLDWYIIKKFLGTYVFAIALIISIAVVFDFNEKMDKLMEHEAPWSKIIFEYYMNFIPYFSNLFSPLFVLPLFSLLLNWRKILKLLPCSLPA